MFLARERCRKHGGLAFAPGLRRNIFCLLDYATIPARPHAAAPGRDIVQRHSHAPGLGSLTGIRYAVGNDDDTAHGHLRDLPAPANPATPRELRHLGEVNALKGNIVPNVDV